MGSFFQQIFNLLTGEAGGLTHSLVVVFAVAGALPGAANLLAGGPRRSRMLAGLGLLLIIRVAQFGLALAAWQGLIEGQTLLPPLERAANLLSLIVLAWLWAFPEPQRAADAAALLVGLLAVTLSALGMVWWAQHVAETVGAAPFNGTLPDQLWNLGAALVALQGVLLLIRRRTPGWGLGLWMLALLGAGHLAALLPRQAGGDYWGVVRLAALVAYPLLLGISAAAPLAAEDREDDRQKPEDEVALEPRTAGDEMGVRTARETAIGGLLAGMELAEASSIEALCPGLAPALAEAFGAGMALVYAPPGPLGEMPLLCVYDRRAAQADNAEEAEAAAARPWLAAAEFPALAGVFKGGRARRIAADASAMDLASLRKHFELRSAGHVLAAPVALPTGTPLAGVALLTLDARRPWRDEDLQALVQAAEALGRLVLRGGQAAALQAQLRRAQEEAGQAAELAEEARREQAALLHQVERLQQGDEGRRLRASGGAARATGAEAGLASGEALGEVERLQGELKLALAELSELRGRLSELESAGSPAAGDAPAGAGGEETAGTGGETTSEELEASRLELIAGIAQELRQPLSSILGYTDFLLGESAGLLGAMQRKFLERMRLATERMTRTLDDLLSAAAPQGAPAGGEMAPVDVSAAIDEAVESATGPLREKKIALRVDVPETMPPLRADRDALHQVVMYLLQNAGAATPPEGEVALRARVERSDGAADYVLLQVTDSGGGIPREELPRVFSRLYRAGNTRIAGVGDTGVGLSIVKALVEAMGGRIWVDSDPGRGATFSVLLPYREHDQAAGAPGGPENPFAGIEVEPQDRLRGQKPGDGPGGRGGGGLRQ